MNILNYCKQGIIFLFLIVSTFQLSAQNVWPGDVNRNGIVNHVDLLYAGWAFGAVGEPREVQGSGWESYPVPSSEWLNQFPNGDNFYYADANGDGIVNNTDVEIITTLNYNLTQGELEPEGYLNADPGSDNPALYFELASSEVFIGEPIQIDLFLGDANNPIDDFHGLALDISYESEHNSTFSSVEYDIDPSSWVQVDNETINFENHEAANKRIDFAVSRLSGNNVDGHGKLGSFIIIVEDIVLNVEADTINFTIDNVKFVGADFETFPVIPASTQFVVKRPDCNVEITYEQHSCSSFTFFEENQIALHWTVNGENTEPASGSPAIDFDPSAAGTYEICGYYETVDCPEGPFACDTIVVSPDCFGDCTVGITINEIDCDTYEIFESSGQQVSWFINDEFVSFFHGIDFDPTEAGTYEICAGIETPDCPQGVFVCDTIVVSPDCFGDCTVGITINEIDCDTYEIFESSGQQVSWFINDEFVSFFHGIDFDPTEAGTYEICAGIETPDCPQGVFVCDTLVITEDCFDDCEFNVEITQQSCSEYELFTTGEELLDWYVNDEFQSTGLGYDFSATNSGTYEICVVNEGCPPETNFCETFVITEDCFSDCNVDISYEEHECDSYTFFSTNQEDLFWLVNGEDITTSSAIDYHPTSAGTYVICGGIETPDCPQGVIACDTLVITEDCFENDCAFNVEINQQSCSEYELFTTGEEQLDWYVNDVFQLTGLEYDFNASEAGTYEICVVNEGCPPETTFCETFVITEDCFENDCAFNVEINQQSCSEYELFTTGEEQLDWYVNDVFQLTGLEYDFSATNSGTYEICVVNEGCPPETNFCETFVISEDCFEDDCAFNVEITQQSCAEYELFTTGEELLDWYVNDEFQLTGLGYDFNASEAGTYEICVVNEGCPPETNFCETFVISEDCFETVNIDMTLKDEEIIIRPSITKSDFRIDGLSGNCIIEVFNQNGKLVFQTIVNGDIETNCDISNLPSGLYYISILNTENKLKRIRKIVKM